MLEPVYEQLPSGSASLQGRRNDPFASVRFGRFEVLPGARTLLFLGSPVEIGGRAFDLLLTLLSAAGQIVPKEHIISKVWPTTTVDESNLRFQMTCLRRILGDESRRIKTIPGRGYIFIEDERACPEAAPPMPWRTSERTPVVIIDSDPQSREHLSRILASAGARVESFATVMAFLTGSETVQGSQRSKSGAALAA